MSITRKAQDSTVNQPHSFEVGDVVVLSGYDQEMDGCVGIILKIKEPVGSSDNKGVEVDLNFLNNEHIEKFAKDYGDRWCWFCRISQLKHYE